MVLSNIESAMVLPIGSNHQPKFEKTNLPPKPSLPPDSQNSCYTNEGHLMRNDKMSYQLQMHAFGLGWGEGISVGRREKGQE